MIRHVLILLMASTLAVSTIGAQQTADSLRVQTTARPWLRDSIPGAGVARGDQRAERGFSVGSLSIRHDPIQDASSLPLALQARLPGVTVTQTEGTLGATSRVWLRGPASVTLNEPLLIIDGVRTHSSAAHRGFETRPLPSRLEDLDMEMVERIDVLRGPAAAAIYGPGASKGVILVTTKRASEGPVRWSAFAESGRSTEVTQYPANFGTSGISTATGNPVANCPLAQQAAGSCTPVERRSWNPLESVSPFHAGWTYSAGARATGGARGVAWSVAASHDRADGVYETDHSRATNGHVSVSAAPAPGVDMLLSATHRIERLHQPFLSPVSAGLFGESADDPHTRGYANGGFRRLTRDAQSEDVDRTTVGLSTRWNPRPWLRTGASLGYDRLEVGTDFRIRAPSYPPPEPQTDSVTSAGRTSDRPEARTAALDATWSYRLRGLASRTTVGLQYLREDDWGASSTSIIADGDQTGGSYESSYDARRSNKGAFVEQHVDWNDRVFLTGSMRIDRPSILDVSLETMVSRALDVSWMAVDQARGGAPSWLGELRVRAAYGVGGDQIIVGQPFSFGGVPPEPPSRETTERGSEVEIGADALVGQHLRASVTWFSGTSSRGLIAYPTFQGQVVLGAGEVGTSGIEATIDSRLLQLGRFAWDMRLVLSRQRSELEWMGLPAFGIDGRYLAAGRPLGEYRAAPYSFSDLDADGLIAPDEVTVLTEEFNPVGSPYPELEAGVSTTLSLGGGVELSALLDRRSGMTLYNSVARLRCRTLCAEQHDPATPLAEQARSVAAVRGGEISYFEDGSYTKLREVRLSVALPAGVARMAGVSGARLSVTGRNLRTWTNFTGLDPEIVSPDVPGAVTTDRLLQPLPRTFMARLDIAW